jgi:hypothetical protein
MFNFLLKNYPQFLADLQKTFKEGDVFQELIGDYIEEKQLKILPITDEATSTYSTFFKYDDGEYFTTFSNNLNFILAKNIKSTEHGNNKAYAYILNVAGKSKMNCFITDFEKNKHPLNFIPSGIGSIEHFFNDDEDIIIHEITFGTWKLSPKAESDHDKVLNIFPIVLDKNQPSMKISSVKNYKGTSFKIKFESGLGKEDNFDIDIFIDNQDIKMIIDVQKPSVEMEQFLKSDGQNSVSELIDGCISDWLSQSIDKSKLYEDLEGKTAGIILRGKITQLPAVPDAILKPHPTIAELSLIEEVSEGESRERSNPNCPAVTVSKPQEVSSNHLSWIKSPEKKR